MKRKRHTYEYESEHHTPHKHRRKRNPALVALDRVLLFLTIPVPLIGLVLWLCDAGIPSLWVACYTAVIQTVAGLLFLVLTALGVGGFGKVGYFFSHTQGKRWMTPEEARGNTFLIGFCMLLIGLLVGLLALRILNG